uniref:phytol kinase n=1 Tax=Tetradesmus obliquus TaxID=3088 RepID=A0A383WPF4_TETOB|eukprot:jgi/Sobl393_1/5244/SZX79044.1
MQDSSSSSSAAGGCNFISPSNLSSSSSNSSSSDAPAGSPQQAVDLGELYADALQLCRVLAAAAPLPLVCNNPGCVNMSGLSETVAASMACTGCRCRYCSAACQATDWERHKPACKRMVAAGQSCGRRAARV